MVQVRTVIVIPMYNEEANVSSLIKQLEKINQENDLGVDILAVDDGSTDSTLDKLRVLAEQYPNVHIASHSKNLGMAAALKTGIKTGLEAGYEAFIFMDGDGTHNPQDIPKFLSPLKEGCDFVTGSRFVPGGGMVNVPLWRVLISKMGNLFGQIALRLPIKDATSGYRGIKRGALEKVSLEETGFPIQLEETIKIAAKGFKMKEIPIILKSREKGQSKFHISPRLILSYASVLWKGLKWRKES